MERFLSEKPIDMKQISPLTLAFVGDTVFDLLVRESIVCEANRPTNDLHLLAVKKVKASAQANFAELLMPYFTDDELAVYKRGRNAKTAHIAKNATTRDYHMASGLEAVFGWLYLQGDMQRIKYLYNIIEGSFQNNEQNQNNQKE